MNSSAESVRSANRIVEALEAAGVKWVFGVPGAKVDQVFDALEDSPIEVVVCRHEQNAAFMAAAVGRLTGHPGVALVTSGPGTSNLATGLVTATTEGDPMIALCGAVPRGDRLKRTHQSMDAVGLLSTVSKFAGEVDAADNVPEAIVNAFRQAEVMPRGAASLVLPSDVMAEHTSVPLPPVQPVPDLGPASAASLDAAAALLREAKFPVILAGVRSACTPGAEALHQLLKATELPVVETFQAAGLVSHDLEDHYLGRVGLFRNQPGDVILDHADVVLAIGYDPVEYDAKMWNHDSSRRIINLDEIAPDIDASYAPVLELRGDIPTTVTALAERLQGLKLDGASREVVDAQLARLAEKAQPSEQHDDSFGLDPVAVTLTLRDLVSDDTTVISDVGSHYIYMARYFRTYRPRRLLFSNGQQTLGVALPWAIATTMVRPGEPVLSVSGDGGFLFSAMELDTAVRRGANFTHVIFNDGTYDMVAFQQMKKYGRTSGITLGHPDLAAYAESFGAHGRRATSLDELVTEVRAGLAESGPTIIDVPVDYRDNLAGLAGDLREGVLS
ncbi:acetolactate synthase AlsS [Pseudoclavibacter sp. 13-3]|uniref:acetolactate synthase AlsS n=1 Tax=Pseudoclavibacter sp. 13-3 TaxID=2901228 RepID=UPI001E2A0A62|nr:acetolactate synthase AlsS [Pseudoclavibacter sp. 13-3]MCD7101801.1 acetolactate synthase AlsS [Pseudoclavibacter sp. 13-3]